jgi:hypothetical protein
LDQAVQKTGFIWSSPYSAELVTCEQSDRSLLLKAVHNGYQRLRNPVRHERTIVFCDDTDFVIIDRFTGVGTHRFELNYHLHPESSVNRDNAWWVIDADGVYAYIAMFNNTEFRLIRGQDDPILGWYSPSYGVKSETSVLHCVQEGAAEEITFTTAVCTEEPPDQHYLLERITGLAS